MLMGLSFGVAWDADICMCIIHGVNTRLVIFEACVEVWCLVIYLRSDLWAGKWKSTCVMVRD